MNIFITHKNPEESAKYLVDLDIKRAKKMLIESIQITSEAIRLLYNLNNDQVFYKFQGNKTPLFWVMQNKENLKWIISYIFHLHLELGNKKIYVKYRKNNPKYKDDLLLDAFHSWIIELKIKYLDHYYNSNYVKIFPMCLCEKSSVIKFENKCSVYNAYKKLLENKTK